MQEIRRKGGVGGSGRQVVEIIFGCLVGYGFGLCLGCFNLLYLDRSVFFCTQWLCES